MIYVDTSVLLARLFAEGRSPPDDFWKQPLVASRLVDYEVWTRVNARGLEGTHGDAARALLGRLAMVELTPPVLARAREPFPVPVRTLDALHLASLHFLKERDPGIRLATYDHRLAVAAGKLGLPVERP
jgi:predicted nucleic acid-binding protein